MPETKDKQPGTQGTQKDAQGVEIDMQAHIPEGTEDAMDADNEDRNMDAKMGDDLGEGLHPTSLTHGIVVSDYATDAAGNTPEDIAEQAEARGVKTGTSGKSDKKTEKSGKSSSK